MSKQDKADKLWELIEKQNKFSTKLKEIQEEINSLKKDITESFSEGQHICKNLVIKVETITTKGRSSPSWKNITENIVNNNIGSKLIEDGYNKKAIREYTEQLKKEYELLKIKHTTIGIDSTKTVVNISLGTK